VKPYLEKPHHKKWLVEWLPPQKKKKEKEKIYVNKQKSLNYLKKKLPNKNFLSG
jgi:hypothetical protein